ncbi:uncharacterized protein LOC117230401 [Bombus vosnesenskii]|uniref:Uncharacterized protein LOC117230401 n=1 Tax=Bombus vosnesenskii TaxID=207650 RepID=A0A6J3JUD2_9HYME|nr:uncharacterized protein LOC117230401 [Bombus vosnesenskii]
MSHRLKFNEENRSSCYGKRHAIRVLIGCSIIISLKQESATKSHTDESISSPRIKVTNSSSTFLEKLKSHDKFRYSDAKALKRFRSTIFIFGHLIEHDVNEFSCEKGGKVRANKVFHVHFLLSSCVTEPINHL